MFLQTPAEVELAIAKKDMEKNADQTALCQHRHGDISSALRKHGG